MKLTLPQQIRDYFIEEYQAPPEALAQAPGRINLIGEHTDYNNGFVFPAAIDKYMYFGFRKNNLNTIRVTALNLNEFVLLDISNLNRSKQSWANYLIGNLIQLQKRGFKIVGFDCAFVSDIPIGSGMSSSSAMECGFLKGMNDLFSLNLSNWEMVDISQKSNHKFLGIKGGILDQFACLFGKEQQAMLLDCKDRTFNYFPIHFEEHRWVLINTMITHDHETSAYNDRVAACQAVVRQASQIFEETSSLRDLNFDQLEEIKSKLSIFEYNCALYILEENERVKQFGVALRTNNISKIGQLIYDSHRGLQHQYKVSCHELDILVDLTRIEKSVVGARMMGGGFGGCTLNLIEKNGLEQTVDSITKAYIQQTDIHPEVYYIEIGNGAAVLPVSV